MKGMNNKLLDVNLSNRMVDELQIDDKTYENYLGGRGIGVKILTDRLSKGIEPLSPENILIFSTGLFGGTSVPTNGRFSLVTKSPLTGGIFYSNSGGFFGPVMKSCGYDGIIITGKFESPHYMVIDGSQEVMRIGFKDADSLLGLDSEETVAKLKEREGDRIRSLIIGPAGENQVLISAIMNDAERAFGRGGVGAVMGSKNLKAIVVKRGKIKPEIAEPDKLKKFVQTALDKIKVVPITRASLPKFGTSALVNIINELGMFPVNNFQKGFHPDADKISGESIRNELLQKDEGCYACPIRCGRMTKAGDMEGKGPEYESVWALGADCGIFDLVTVAQANYLCNKLGMDTISAGGAIACAMELQQKGLIKDPSITFGNGSILKDLIRKMAKKEGIGAELSQGSKRLAEKYESPESAIHVKGLELPAYDPRGAVGHALGYATSNRGGCHLTGYLAAMEIFAAPKKINRFTVGGKSDLLVLKQHQSVVEDSLVVCKFAGWALGNDFYSRMATAISGYDFNITKLLEIGERVYNLERLFNIREGFTRKDDTLAPRFLNEPLKEGFSKDKVVPLENMLDEYYTVRNWDKNGIPKLEHIKNLGIEFQIGG
jgi:aldehyde:ferredoxin oxidoreductase